MNGKIASKGLTDTGIGEYWFTGRCATDRGRRATVSCNLDSVVATMVLTDPRQCVYHYKKLDLQDALAVASDFLKDENYELES